MATYLHLEFFHQFGSGPGSMPSFFSQIQEPWRFEWGLLDKMTCWDTPPEKRIQLGASRHLPYFWLFRMVTDSFHPGPGERLSPKNHPKTQGGVATHIFFWGGIWSPRSSNFWGGRLINPLLTHHVSPGGSWLDGRIPHLEDLDLKVRTLKELHKLATMMATCMRSLGWGQKNGG